MRIAKIVKYGGKHLALNLDWLPVLGNTKSVLAQIRHLGASHYLCMGEPVTAMGFTSVKKITRLWSLAHLYAMANQNGTCACVLRLDQHSWHVLAAHHGIALVHADRTYPDELAANAAIGQFKLTYPGIQITAVDDVDSFLQQMAELAHEHLALNKIRRSIYWLALLVLVLLLAVFFGEIAEPEQQPAQIDIKQAWQRSLVDTLAKHKTHGKIGTRALLTTVHTQPVFISGWLLHNLSCKAQTTRTNWSCRSEYRRIDKNSNNLSLIDAAPVAWQFQFRSLDLAYADWQIMLPTEQVLPGKLPKSKFIARNWSSSLQAVLPAFTGIQIGLAKTIEIAAPLDERGQSLPKPDDLPVIATKQITVSGPLRSSVLLTDLADAIAWDKLEVSYKSGVKASLQTSSLTIQLQGAIYEQRS